MEKTHCCLSAESYIYLDELHLGVWETISPIEVFCIILFSSILVSTAFHAISLFFIVKSFCVIQNLKRVFCMSYLHHYLCFH